MASRYDLLVEADTTRAINTATKSRTIIDVIGAHVGVVSTISNTTTAILIPSAAVVGWLPSSTGISRNYSTRAGIIGLVGRIAARIDMISRATVITRDDISRLAGTHSAAACIT